MLNKLSAKDRNTIITNAISVYNSFLLLDIVNNAYYSTISGHKDSFKLNGKATSFKELIASLELSKRADSAFERKCKIGAVDVTLGLKKDGDAWVVALVAPKPQDGAYTPKDIGSATGEDFLHLLRTHSLRITFDPKKSNAIAISTHIGDDKALEIGGVGKIDLYQIHLQNLYSIIEQLQDLKNDPNILIAMVTGSGKSFSQALHYLIMAMSGMKYISSVPSQALAEQLLKDFKRVLPDVVVDTLVLGTSAEAKPAPSMIVTHEYLLRSIWDQVKSDGTYTIAIDEQHEAAKEELYKRRMGILAKNNPVMLLSATPTQDAYDLCNQKVLNLSKADKEALGIAQPAQNIVATAEGSIDKGQAQSSIFSFFERFKKFFVDSIEKERVSAAFEYVDQTETTIEFRDKKDPLYLPSKSKNLDSAMEYLRNNMQSPLGQKALIFVDDHDELINLNLALNQGDSAYAYSAGNKVTRFPFYDFVFWAKPGKDTDTKYLEQYGESKLESRKNLIRRNLQEQGFAKRTIEDVLKNISLFNKQSPLETKELVRSYLKEHFSEISCKATLEAFIYSPISLSNYKDNKAISMGCYNILLKLFGHEAETADNLINNKDQSGILLKAVKAKFDDMKENNTLSSFLEERINEVLEKLTPDPTIHKAFNYKDARIMHGMVDYLLQRLTGYDVARLDKERRNNPEELIKLISERLNAIKTPSKFDAWIDEMKVDLKSNLDAGIAIEATKALKAIARFAKDNLQTEGFIAKLAHNWEFDKSPLIYGKSLYQALYDSSSVRLFCNKYKTIFYVKGLQNTPTKIPEKPFLELSEKSYRIHADAPKDVNKDDHVHPLSTAENLNPFADQYYYTPLDHKTKLDEKSVDFLFKMGFVGAYITNQKVVGFNDPNLNHVGYVLNKSNSELNNPAQIIQGSGRNRGLNPYKKPFFFISNIKDVVVSFAIETLDLQNYLPHYFKSKEGHQKLIKKQMA